MYVFVFKLKIIIVIKVCIERKGIEFIRLCIFIFMCS